MAGQPRPLPADALRLLQERFRASSPALIARFRTLVAALAAAPADPDVLDDVCRELHRTHGTAGSYGFTAASRLAADLEARVVQWAADPLLERTERVTILGEFVKELIAAFEERES